MSGLLILLGSVRRLRIFWIKWEWIEREIYEVRLEAPEDQLNFGLKLNNDLAVLLVEIETGDGRPTAAQYAVFKELTAQLRVHLDALDGTLARDLPALNRLLARESLEPVK